MNSEKAKTLRHRFHLQPIKEESPLDNYEEIQLDSDSRKRKFQSLPLKIINYSPPYDIQINNDTDPSKQENNLQHSSSQTSIQKQFQNSSKILNRNQTQKIINQEDNQSSYARPLSMYKNHSQNQIDPDCQSKYSIKSKLDEFKLLHQKSSDSNPIQQIREAIRGFFLRCCPKLYKQCYASKNISQDQINEELSLSKEMDDILVSLNEVEKMSKALRHFYDRFQYYFLRTSRNDLDQKKSYLILAIWNIITNTQWNQFLWLVSFAYQFQVFWEPQNSHSQELLNPNLLILEAFWLILFLMDVLLNIIFFLKTNAEKKFQKFLLQKKILFKLIFLMILLSDYCFCLIYYPNNSLRFSRLIRALLLICFSQDMRRNLQGILNCLKHLLLLFLLYFIIICLWSFIGINLLIDISSIPIDEVSGNYGEFFNLTFMLYIFSTLDYFPNIMMPQIIVSRFYLFYYIPYLFLFLFLFIPIPQALLFESFQSHRVGLEQIDQLKQKKSLAMCFYCLDDQRNGEVPYEKLLTFFSQIYKNPNRFRDIKELLELINFDQSGTYSVDEFFHLPKIINTFPQFSLTRIEAPIIWDQLLDFLDKQFNLRVIVLGDKFNFFMIGMTFINCALIIGALFVEDKNTLEIFEIIDKVFFAIYALEVLLKILAVGLYCYFEDIWNKFDFTIVFLQFFFDFILINTISSNVSSSLKANRVLRLAKIQKIFRLFRAFRSLKIFTILLDGLAIFEEIIMCLPVVIRFVLLIWILFYSYAVLAVEILYNQASEPNIYTSVECIPDEIKELIDYGACLYSDFSTVERSLFLLLKIFIFSWADVINDYSHRLNNLWLVAAFLGSFVFFAIFFSAIVNGLVWEIFNKMSQSTGDEEFEETMLKRFEKKMEGEKDQDQLQTEQNRKTQIQAQKTPQSEDNLSQGENNNVVRKSKRKETKFEVPKLSSRNQNKKKTIHKKEDDCSEIQFSESDDFKKIFKNDEEENDIGNLFSISDNEDNIPQKMNQSSISERSKSSNSFFIKGQYLSSQISKLSFDDNRLNSLDISTKRKTDIFEKLKPLSDPTLVFRHKELFGDFKTQLDHIFEEGYQYFKSQATQDVDQKDQLRKTLKAQLGYSENELEEQQKAVISQQQQFLYYLSFLFKQNLNCKQLLEIITNLDQIISKQFLPDKSFTRFLFQNQENQWYLIQNDKGKASFKSINEGPWATYDNIFKSKTPFSADHNIYFYDANRESSFSNDDFDLLFNELLINLKETIFGKFEGKRSSSDSRSVKRIKLDDITKKLSLAWVFVCIYPLEIESEKEDKLNAIKNFMQIWYIQKPKEEIRSRKRKASYLQVLNQQKKSSFYNLLQMVAENQDQKQEDANLKINKEQEKHSILQTINLCKDIWKIIRGNENFIKSKIFELEEKRKHNQSKY